MTQSMQREIVLLLTWMFIMLVVGLIFDATLVFLLIGLGCYVTWSLYNLNRLIRWLSKPTKQPPEVTGIWDDVYYQLYQIYKRQSKARKKLTSILSRFKKSTRALPYATVVLNELGEIEWFNPAAKLLFQLHSKIDIGQRIDNLIRQPKFSSYLNKKNFDEPVELEIQHKKILISITPFGGGQFLLSARDTTALNKIDEMRRNFISNASHELRTPLTVMSGYVEFLEHKADDKIKEPLDRIQNQITRMNTIIQELIELARLESASEVDHTNEINIIELVEDVYNEILTFDNGTHDIILEMRACTPETIKASLFGNRKEVRMALSNLLTNAIRYTPENGKITLFCELHDNHLSIGVEDSGIGISYEHIPRLTERFYRVDEGRSREQGGTGLGLAIVKHVLDRHNATLYIQSVFGRGSIFRCDFTLVHIETNEQTDNITPIDRSL